MSRVPVNKQLLPSLLDRLIDREPAVKRDAPKEMGQIIRDLKQTVARDLENLLNTRCRAMPFPKEYDELPTSLVNYGLPDLAAANAPLAERKEEFRVLIEQCLRKYEPRFKTVRVQFIPGADETSPVLRFRIDALLRTQPLPEAVSYDSTLDPGSATFEVKKAAQ